MPMLCLISDYGDGYDESIVWQGFWLSNNIYANLQKMKNPSKLKGCIIKMTDRQWFFIIIRFASLLLKDIPGRWR
jgi:hypothetical protein